MDANTKNYVDALCLNYPPEKRVEMHRQITSSLSDTYMRKNHDYGNSFAIMRQRMSNAILVRLFDKYLRIEQLLSSGEEALVKDESIEDTLLDLANYAIMEVLERRLYNKTLGELAVTSK